jgi:hypothetical protein
MDCRTWIPLLAVAASASVFAVGCDGAPVSEPEATMFDLEVANLNRTQHDLPFKGSLDGVANFIFDETERAARCRTTNVPFVTESRGSGNASHMGRLTWSSSHCTEDPRDEPPYYVFERGEWILVAANGDEIHMEYTGEQNDPINQDDPQPMILVGHGTITGGTGRFANATGWIEMRGEVRLPPGGLYAPDWPVHFDLEGRISLAEPRLPFHSEYSWDFVQLPVPADRCTQPPPEGLSYLWLTEITGTTNSTHLGRGTAEGSICIYGQLTDPDANPPDNGIPVGWQNGLLVFTAANGDQLHAADIHTTGFTAPPGTPGFKFIEAGVFVGGGTGRFQHAEGEFTATVDPVTQVAVYEGWIRYGKVK